MLCAPHRDGAEVVPKERAGQSVDSPLRDGETLSETSLLDLCLKHETIRRAIETESVKEFTYGRRMDLLHTNTIAYLDEDVLVAARSCSNRDKSWSACAISI